MGLSYHIYGRMLRSLPFLGWIREMDACLKELAIAVVPQVFTKGDVLFRRGQEKRTIIVLIFGMVKLSVNESLTQLTGKERNDDLDIGWEEHEDRRHMADTWHVPRATDNQSLGAVVVDTLKHMLPIAAQKQS